MEEQKVLTTKQGTSVNRARRELELCKRVHTKGNHRNPPTRGPQEHEPIQGLDPSAIAPSLILRETPVLGLKLCSGCLEILNNFTFKLSFCR